MLSKEKLNRINQLAKKAKTKGLTEKEAKEQTALRKEYLQTFRTSMRSTIENTKVIDPNGNDVTPKKLRDAKNKKIH